MRPWRSLEDLNSSTSPITLTLTSPSRPSSQLTCLLEAGGSKKKGKTSSELWIRFHSVGRQTRKFFLLLARRWRCPISVKLLKPTQWLLPFLFYFSCPLFFPFCVLPVFYVHSRTSSTREYYIMWKTSQLIVLCISWFEEPTSVHVILKKSSSSLHDCVLMS